MVIGDSGARKVLEGYNIHRFNRAGDVGASGNSEAGSVNKQIISTGIIGIFRTCEWPGNTSQKD
jgi:hypothetical protein